MIESNIKTDQRRNERRRIILIEPNKPREEERHQPVTTDPGTTRNQPRVRDQKLAHESDARDPVEPEAETGDQTTSSKGAKNG